MKGIYSLLVKIVWYLLRLVAKFQPKIRLFVKGRKETFQKLENIWQPQWKVIWMHVASLGEYEQGLPLLEQLKKVYGDHKLVITFFSPSGYEVKKDKTPADLVVYLPMDTISNARKFLGIVQPKLAVFIKYEIWPNYLFELKKNEIPTLLVSGVFKKKQAYFNWYGGFLRSALQCFTHFFVQDDNSKALLAAIGLTNVTISGDTRFDRVSQILDSNNQMAQIGRFKKDNLCLVAGSTWPEDEKILLPVVNAHKRNLRFVIAPHNIKRQHIQDLKAAISKKTILYSEMENQDPDEADVLIVDTIGLLTKIYSYADIAYVGGGFATGLHNTLEPAVFGIPVIIGPNYSNFIEAADLVQKGGIIVIRNTEEFETITRELLAIPEFKTKTGAINNAYIQQKVGATNTIMQYITDLI